LDWIVQKKIDHLLRERRFMRMNSKVHWKGLILVLTLFALLLGGCGSPESETVTLRMAVLPVLDTLPMHVAAEEGYFQEAGVEVEFIPVASAPERDQLISAGRADGMLNEIVSTLFYNQDQVQVQIVRTARAASAEAPLFRILASGESEIRQPEDLKGVEIGISEGTVIEYITDRLLEDAGFTENEIAKLPVPKIPDRLALLGSGELDAAVLPDPLSELAVQDGARVVLDDTRLPRYSLSVIAFRTEVLEEHPEAVRAFLAAVERAVTAINHNPERYAEIMSEKELVPPPVLGDYRVNPFPLASVPSQTQWQDAVDWARENGLIESDLPYDASVTDRFLP
jgi:NitT/TauT family transport system substrate-binding protein